MALAAFCVAAFFHPVAYHFYFYYVGGFAVAFSEIVKRFDVGPHGERSRRRPVLVPLQGTEG
jgi:hypothetical protein